MSAHSNKSTQALFGRFMRRQPVSLKTACVEVLGTQNKTNVMRVLRTQDLIGYVNGGGRHEILERGNFYFTYDAERRAEGKQLVPGLHLPDDWAQRAGSEIYISPMNTLKLMRELFDVRMMGLIEPPKLIMRQGMKRQQQLALIEHLDEIDEEFNEVDGTPENPFRQMWLARLNDAIASGIDATPDIKAGLWLTRPHNMALLNETAERAGIDLTDTAAGRIHVEKFCSFPMKEILGHVFTSEEALSGYLASVAAMTAEVFLGYCPELV